jgi:hypothetical protein
LWALALRCCWPPASHCRPRRTTHKQDVIQVNNVYPGPAVLLLTGARWLPAAGYRRPTKKLPVS